MKSRSCTTLGLIALLALPLCSGYCQSVADVLKLSHSGVGEDVILAYVQGAQSLYNLSAADVLHLTEAGLSLRVLKAMQSHDSALRNAEQPEQTTTSQKPSSLENRPETNRPGSQSAAQSASPASTLPPPTAPLPGTTAPAAGPLPPSVAVVAPPSSDDGAVRVYAEPMVADEPVEMIPVSPGPEYYWAPGYWGWNRGWVWIGPAWHPRAGYGAGRYHSAGTGYHGGRGGYHGGGSSGHGGDRGGHGR
jgi:hypothetical protein